MPDMKRILIAGEKIAKELHQEYPQLIKAVDTAGRFVFTGTTAAIAAATAWLNHRGHRHEVHQA